MSALYKTERLEAYDWGKELRLKHLNAVATARDEGRFLVVGNMNFPKELLTGLGDFTYLAGEPWAVSINQGDLRVELRPLEAGGFQHRGERKLTPFEKCAWDAQFKPGLRLQAQRAVDMLKGPAFQDLPTLEDNLVTMRLIRDIYGI